MSKNLLMIAVLPTFVIFAIVIKNARAAKEPFKKIAKVFGISVASTIVAIILEALGDALLDAVFKSMGLQSHSVLWILAECFFVIALVEEGCKYFSFKLMIFQDRAFDNTYDGVIYGAASALGFATLENILYVFQTGFGTGILRAVLSVPLHACTGIYMGYKFGISKYNKYNDIRENKNPQRLAYVVAVVIHALYDFFAMGSNAVDAPKDFFVVTLVGILVIMIIVYTLMIITIKKAKREDQPIYNWYYYQHLNGAYQDMRGTTSEKMEGDIPMNPTMAPPVNAPYGAPMGAPMAQPYGQPMPRQNMNPVYRPPVYSAPNMPPQNFGQPAPQFNMNAAMAANRNMPGGYRPPAPGYGAPMNAPVPQRAPSAVQTMEPPTTPAVHFCNECGNRLEGFVSVCPVCGSKIDR
ncbi:PrsW family glutamic-type intramembrane protease [Ruminococcus sp.]|uniref:PrsW family intramembrane metalloprotease n=1 Tax=Ruminococcus sp. TaxID=41978 RepID=UPI0025F283D1|nr:PrsW family glutamic-type intramembrane protease [Ruminococcus sp.]MBQ8965399.1 PrsW family intramembrane metalloprotease [Ruminococcus sp.]